MRGKRAIGESPNLLFRIKSLSLLSSGWNTFTLRYPCLIYGNTSCRIVRFSSVESSYNLYANRHFPPMFLRGCCNLSVMKKTERKQNGRRKVAQRCRFVYRL